MIRDLKSIFHDHRLNQKILVESGSLKGKKIKGLFNLVYGDERLGRRSIETVSGEFIGLISELSEIKTGDEVSYKKDLFLVVAVMETPNGMRLELNKKVSGYGRKS